MDMSEEVKEEVEEEEKLDFSCKVYGVETPSTPCSCYPEED